MKYARFSSDNIVIEVFTPPTEFTLEQCFHPVIAAQFEPCPDYVESNWIKNPDGTFTEPTPLPELDTVVDEPVNP